MGTVTAYDMSNIQSALGGSNPISLNEYYRGGAYVPSTRSTSVREPTSGENYNIGTPFYAFINFSGINQSDAFWQNGQSPYVFTVYSDSATSITAGGYTYYRGTYRGRAVTSYYTEYRYGIYRTYTSTTSINTGVPSSGQISISQLYGAQNP